MRLKQYLTEESIDSDDWGATGKAFEKTFLRACDLLGLKYVLNGVNARGWDMKPVGDGWERIISDKEVNIKVSSTKWLFGSTELTTIVPWDNIPDDYNEDLTIKRIKRILHKIDIPHTVFLKPKDKNVQQSIVDGVRSEDIPALEKIFVKKNFYSDKLGNTFDVRILKRDNRVTSIAVNKKGKVFMRSEPPRKVGGSMFVTFRTPTAKLDGGDRKVKS